MNAYKNYKMKLEKKNDPLMSQGLIHLSKLANLVSLCVFLVFPLSIRKNSLQVRDLGLYISSGRPQDASSRPRSLQASFSSFLRILHRLSWLQASYSGFKPLSDGFKQ